MKLYTNSPNYEINRQRISIDLAYDFELRNIFLII
jgi:hypothetical protein